MKAVLVLTTAPAKAAGRLAALLVRQKLAACVSLKSGFVSTYRWNGRIEKAREALLLIKTTRPCLPGLKKFIQKQHPYDLPELIVIPIGDGSSEYLKWIEQSV